MSLKQLFLIILLFSPLTHPMQQFDTDSDVHTDKKKIIVPVAILAFGSLLFTVKLRQLWRMQRRIFEGSYPGMLTFNLGTSLSPDNTTERPIVRYKNTKLPCFGIAQNRTDDPYCDITWMFTPSKWGLWWNNEKEPRRIFTVPINEHLERKDFKGTLMLMEYKNDKHWMHIVGHKDGKTHIYVHDASKATMLNNNTSTGFNPPGFIIITSQQLGQDQKTILDKLEQIKTNLQEQPVENIAKQIITPRTPTSKSGKSALVIRVKKKDVLEYAKLSD